MYVKVTAIFYVNTMVNLNVYELNKTEKTAFYIGVCLLGIFLSLLFYKSIIFSIVVIPFIPRLKSYLVDYLTEKRRDEYLLQFKDFLFQLSTSIGAGRAMKDAIAESIPGLVEIYGEKAVLVGVLRNVYERMDFGGENDVDVLVDMAVQSGLDDVIDFVSIYSICKTSGASLIIALNKAANVIIEKMTIEKEIEELIKRKEVEGLVIFIMPILIILFLNVCAPDYISPLYGTIIGRIIMTSAIACEIGIFGMIKKITKVDI